MRNFSYPNAQQSFSERQKLIEQRTKLLQEIDEVSNKINNINNELAEQFYNYLINNYSTPMETKLNTKTKEKSSTNIETKLDTSTDKQLNIICNNTNNENIEGINELMKKLSTLNFSTRGYDIPICKANYHGTDNLDVKSGKEDEAEKFIELHKICSDDKNNYPTIDIYRCKDLELKTYIKNLLKRTNRKIYLDEIIKRINAEYSDVYINSPISDSGLEPIKKRIYSIINNDKNIKCHNGQLWYAN